MKFLGSKNKQDNMKGAWPDSDQPSIKIEDAVYMLPNIEVIIYKSEKELKSTFKSYNGFVMDEKLWGWVEVNERPGEPVRIHLRSVRSHGSKDSFYHTLGHEISHVLEGMEQQKPEGSYTSARWKAFMYTLQVTYYVYSEKIKEEIKSKGTCAYRRMGRKYPKVFKKLKQSVQRLRKIENLLHW